jgi:hypothetical protein
MLLDLTNKGVFHRDLVACAADTHRELVDIPFAALQNRGPRLHDWWTKSPPPADPKYDVEPNQTAPGPHYEHEWGEYKGVVLHDMDMSEKDAAETLVIINIKKALEGNAVCGCAYCEARRKHFQLPDMRECARAQLEDWYKARQAAALQQQVLQPEIREVKRALVKQAEAWDKVHQIEVPQRELAKYAKLWEEFRDDVEKVTGIKTELLMTEKRELTERRSMLAEQERVLEEKARLLEAKVKRGPRAQSMRMKNLGRI